MRFIKYRRDIIWPRQRSGHLMKLFVAFSVMALLLVPLALSTYEYPWIQTALATLLIGTCIYPSVRYFARQESGLPTMPVFCLAWAMQFGFPIFTNESSFLLMAGEVHYLDDSDVNAALLMAIVGIAALQLGYYWLQNSSYRHVIPVARLPLKKSRALVYCVAVGILLPALFTFRGVIPEEYQQPLSSVLRLLSNQVLVVIGILGWIYYSRRDSRLYGLWLYGLVFLFAFRGISTGSLEEALVPFGVLFVVKWLYTRRVPVTPVLATAALVLLLSPVKSDYRQKVWFGEDPELAEQSTLTRGAAWIEDAAEYWQETLTGNRDISEATSSATGRADFVHQVAYIYSMTPAVVPYQLGKTYSFFVVTFVPRIVWPDKPVAGNANGFYAVTYGVTSEEGAKTTAFGVSVLGESYMNFGWFGVVFMMLLQGLLISAIQHSFGNAVSGPGGQAVFLAFFVYFLNGIGSSAEIMFGGIIQNLICGYLLLLWAKQKRALHPESHSRALSSLPLAVEHR